jgi:predicted ATPase
MPELPIAIETLSIQDFRGIESIEMDFRGPDGVPNQLVVLAGPNGSGKTAVLEAALICSGGSEAVAGKIGPQAVRRGAKDYEIKGRIKCGEGTRHTNAASNREPGKLFTADYFFYHPSWRVPGILGAVSAGATSLGVNSQPERSGRLREVKQALADGSTIEKYRTQNPPDRLGYAKWMELINWASHLFYPNDGEFKVDVVDDPRPGMPPLDVFLARHGGPKLSVDELSAGQMELFIFAASLAMKTENAGLIFIDEPELHLDPQWHRPLMKALVKLQPKAQFIVATHSPEIYDAALSYERHFLVPEDDPRARIWQEIRPVESGT